MKLRIDQLKLGQRVDLQNDMIADPEAYQAFQNGEDGGAVTSHPEFEFDYEVVHDLIPEGPDCICVNFNSGFACGFPPDHLVDIDPEQPPEELS